MVRSDSTEGRGDAREFAHPFPELIYNTLSEAAKVFLEKGKATDKSNQQRSEAGLEKYLGPMTLVDQSTVGKDNKSDRKDRAGDAPVSPDKTTDETATHLRSRAEFELKDSRKGAAYTLSGGSPRLIAYNDSYSLTSNQNAIQISFLQLGWDATLKQREAYVHAVEELNQDKLQDDGAGHKSFPEGTKIKLPGQTAEGGLTWRTAQGTKTVWNDGATLFEASDKSGYANYQNRDAGVTARWNPAKREDNFWATAVGKENGSSRYYEMTETSFDAQDRTVQRVHRSDNNVPESIRIIDKAGTVIDLKPGDDGEFRGQKTNRGKVLDADVRMTADGRIYSLHTTPDGKIVKNFEEAAPTGKTENKPEDHSKDELVSFKNPENDSQFTINRDGSTYSQVKLASGNLKRVRMSGGEILTDEVSKDASGAEHLLKRSATDVRNGNAVEYSYTNDQLDRIHIHSKAGETMLSPTDDGLYGMNFSSSGKIELTRATHGMLVYKDMFTGAMRADSLDKDPGHFVPSLAKLDYDSNTGSIERDLDSKLKTVQSYAPGRQDMVAPDGTVTGTTITGDQSYQKSSGEAAVVHAGGDGIHMTPDGKIESWTDGLTFRDTLAPQEASFLKDNPTSDRRDLLEIHRRFRERAEKLDGFYAQLKRIEASDKLSMADKMDLERSLMHHVAYPAEIYQGSSPTCNVSVIQRDVAITHPDKYAKFVVDAVVDGEFTNASDKTVKFDVGNLTLRDFSGRDLATRVFQTAALNMLRYPHQTFENTVNGTGRFREMYPMFNHYVPTDNVTDMDGLYLPEMARIRYELTGESKAQVSVHSVDDLVAVFKHNGGEPMSIWVDADTYPFAGTGPIGTRIGGHVVTVTGMTQEPVLKFQVQNNWGLESDHSGITTSIEGEDLFNNMARLGKPIVLASAPEVDKYYKASMHADGSLKYEESGEPDYDWMGNLVE